MTNVDKTSSKHNDKTSSHQIVNMRGRIDSSLTLKETVLELGLAHGLANLHEIADYTNLAYRTLANMSHRKPTRRTYLRLADVFDVDVVDLYRLRIK